MKQSNYLFIGGHPKGYHIPFHPNTLSGKRLRKLLEKLPNTTIKVMDLWENEEQEKKGLISMNTIYYIEELWSQGYKIIALGKWVHKCLDKIDRDMTVHYLPHPASRRKKDLEKLKSFVEINT